MAHETARPHAGAVGWLLAEVRHVLPPTIFFAVGFNLVAFSMRLVLAQYSLQTGNLLLATTAALIVGKAMLVADKMPFLTRFDDAPLYRTILFKTAIYWLFVFIARLIEAYVSYAIEEGRLTGFMQYVAEQFSWNRFLFIQLWILVLFLVYLTGAEVSGLFGEGGLPRVLFGRRPAPRPLDAG